MSQPAIDSVDHSERAHADFGPSSLKHVKLCAGYHGKDGTNDAAEKGTRIHEALEVRDPSALQSDEEMVIYERLLSEEIEMFSLVFGGISGVTITREARLHLDLDCESPTFGTSDIVAFKGDVGLQIDYKTGVSRIDEPRDNMQAKCYVLAMFQANPHINLIHFAFLVPQRDQILTGTFNRSEMEELRNEISSIISKAEKIRPKWDTGQIEIEDVNPNVDCRFCRHEDRCPALGAVAITIAKRVSPQLIPDGPINQSEVDDPAVIERLYIIAKIVESWASGIKFKALSLALAGTEYDTLKLKSMGASKVTLHSKYLADLAMKHGLTLDEVLEHAKISLGSMSDAIYEKAPKRKKGSSVSAFEEEALELGVVELGKTRYTLSSK